MPLEHSPRPLWLTFDCYGTLIQWDEGLRAAIDRILDALKPQVRKAFLWAQLEGLTCRQIAERLGVSLATAERYVAAALRHCYSLRFGG